LFSESDIPWGFTGMIGTTLSRQKLQKALNLVQGFFHFRAAEKQSPCGLCVGDSKLFACERKAGRIDLARDERK